VHPKGREAAREALGDELEEALGLWQVLEAVPAQLAERGPAVLDEPGRPLRRDHLTAVCRRRDARRPVNVDPDVVAVGDDRLARVQAHADAQGLAVRPRMTRQRALSLLGRRERAVRVGEGDEEAVPLRVALAAVVSLEGGTQQPAVVAENLRVPLSEGVQQTGRALDVSEQESDAARGELPHHAKNRALRPFCEGQPKP
jgi:hypothetical protein